MSDNTEKLKTDNKNPLDSAVNKLKETAANEFNKKYFEQVKVINNARKVLATEVGKLKDLAKEIEVEKLELAELLKELR